MHIHVHGVVSRMVNAVLASSSLVGGSVLFLGIVELETVSLLSLSQNWFKGFLASRFSSLELSDYFILDSNLIHRYTLLLCSKSFLSKIY